MNIEPKPLSISSLQTGDVIIFHDPLIWHSPMTWLCWAIRKVTKSYWNHAGVVIEDWGVPFFNEAEAQGVMSDPIADRLVGYTIYVRRPVVPVDEKAFAVKANNKLGVTGYFFAGLVYQLIFQWTHCWTGPASQERAATKMYCSEYVAFLYNMDKFWEVTPQALAISPIFTDVFMGEVTALTA